MVPGQTMVHHLSLEAWSAAKVTFRCRSASCFAHASPPNATSTAVCFSSSTRSAGEPPMVRSAGRFCFLSGSSGSASTALITVRTTSAYCAPKASATASKPPPSTVARNFASPASPVKICTPSTLTLLASRTTTETSSPLATARFAMAAPRLPLPPMTRNFILLALCECERESCDALVGRKAFAQRLGARVDLLDLCVKDTVRDRFS
mmetsp:Transcript_8619/g.25929  ORF Transcript_8619/g.25929 Transcript_8619/m.25929 type:complete len:207 (+) Transcript_8619:286-906(+)